jgi:hypothetical protein
MVAVLQRSVSETFYQCHDHRSRSRVSLKRAFQDAAFFSLLARSALPPAMFRTLPVFLGPELSKEQFRVPLLMVSWRAQT